eukprot:6188700-Pleurochrysis_carterae.AAC.1
MRRPSRRALSIAQSHAEPERGSHTHTGVMSNTRFLNLIRSMHGHGIGVGVVLAAVLRGLEHAARVALRVRLG